MKKDNSVFDELQTSLKQAAAIRKGEMKPSRVFKVDVIDVKVTRENNGDARSQANAAIR